MTSHREPWSASKNAARTASEASATTPSATASARTCVRPATAAEQARAGERPQRQHEVEGHLDAQRPRGPDAAEHGLDAEVLDEAEVAPPVAVEHRDPSERTHDEEREPERRDDPQQAPAQVAPGPRGGAAVEAGGDERAVEQEARQDEEQRDTGVEAGRERAERVRAREAGAVADVQHDDAERGQRADAVEQREPRVAGRRRDVRGGRAHEWRELTAARDGSGRGEASRA